MVALDGWHPEAELAALARALRGQLGERPAVAEQRLSDYGAPPKRISVGSLG